MESFEMKATILLLSLALSINVYGQQPASKQISEERVQKVILELEAEKQECERLQSYMCPLMEFFLDQLKEGKRGDGIHHRWMDKMKLFGIKQAAFIVHFNWKNGAYHLKVKKITYLKQYYRYDTEVKDKQLLRQIEIAGLDQELSEAILEEIKPEYSKPKAKESVSEGDAEYNLLDDEALPAYSIITWLE